MVANMDFTRQIDIINPSYLTEPITVIGLGGIGSFTVPILAKMGCSNITGYEPDIVEDHNLPNQNFRLADDGRLKAEALSEIVTDFSGLDLKIITEKFTGQHDLSGIVISAVDSMDSRMLIWNNVKFNPAVRLYIDSRMGGEMAHLFTVNPCTPSDIELYEAKLYPEDETKELPCTARSIIFTVYFIAGLIANQVKKFALAQEINREIIWDAMTLTLIQNK